MDQVRLAEDYAYLQHLADGRMDLTMGRVTPGRSTHGLAKIFAKVSHWL